MWKEGNVFIHVYKRLSFFLKTRLQTFILFFLTFITSMPLTALMKDFFLEIGQHLTVYDAII